ncbi:MAG: flavin reductase family protein [Thermomicrobiales bacterium]
MPERTVLERRDALRMLAPGPVTLISTIHRDHPNLMTASWLLPLSLSPVYVGLAIQPSRLTHEFVSKSEAFAINIPNIDLLTAVNACGMTSGRDADKWQTTRLTPVDASEIEAPLIEECVGFIECLVVDRITFGDHDLFVGRVVAVSAAAEAFPGHWDVSGDGGRILHHLGGDRYAGLGRNYQVTQPEE